MLKKEKFNKPKKKYADMKNLKKMQPQKNTHMQL